MQGIEGIIKYQAVDESLHRIESQYRASTTYKKYKECKDLVANFIETIAKFAQEAIEMQNSYSRLDESVKKEEIELEELKNAIDNQIQTDDFKEIERKYKEFEFYLKKFEKVSEALNLRNNEILKMRSRIDAIIRETSRLITDYSKNTVNLNELSKKVNEYQIKNKDIIEKHKKAKANLEAIVDKNLLEIYKQVAKDTRPAFVPLLNNEQCSGCRMDLPFDVLTKLKKSGDYIECPNCRRILYFIQEQKT